MIIPGEKIKMFGYWYRHDTVEIDGKVLGYIQVRHYHKRGRWPARTESITCFKNACVLGTDVGWLIRMNTNPDPVLVEAMNAHA